MEMATEFQSVFQPSLLGKRSAKNGFKTINTLIVYYIYISGGEELKLQYYRTKVKHTAAVILVEIGRGVLLFFSFQKRGYYSIQRNS